MAREKVVKVKCDRCNRTELMQEVPNKEKPDFKASFLEKELVYEDLCYRCRSAIDKIWEDLKEYDRQIKYTVIENGPRVGDNEAAPLNVAPDYSPPKPNSQAAVTKR